MGIVAAGFNHAPEELFIIPKSGGNNFQTRKPLFEPEDLKSTFKSTFGKTFETTASIMNRIETTMNGTTENHRYVDHMSVPMRMAT